MDEPQFEDAIDRLVLEGRHQKAEEMLIPVYEEAKRKRDVQSLDSALRLLVFVEGSAAHPNIEKLEKFRSSVRGTNPRPTTNSKQRWCSSLLGTTMRNRRRN